MKLRIIPSSTGTKGVDWTRIYVVQFKMFLWWREVKRFDDIQKAHDFVTHFADWNELIFVKYV